jgi:acetylornithine aminotransferase
MGRTGTLFAYESSGIAPDIMTLAKALANGLPMGAMLAREAVAAAFGPGAHASTFGGTPIVSAAALEVCRVLEGEGVLDHCRRVSAHFRARLEWLRDRHALVAEVRGLGLLLGLRLTCEGEPFVRRCMERGFLINCVQGTILRFVPPLVISVEEIDALIACLDELLAA